MATIAQLQQSPVYQKQQNRIAYQDLTTAPLTFLTQKAVSASAGAGHQTVLTAATGFSLNRANTVLTIGIGVTPGNYPNRILVPTLQTQTRDSTGAGLAQRWAAVQRFAFGHGGALLWLTDQQSGCTLLMLDWGLQQYSMFHLLPYQNADFNRFTQGLMKLSDPLRSTIKNSSLRTETTAVVNASLAGGAQPQRYILIQSQHTARRGFYMQVIGVARNGGWEFYRQINRLSPTGLVADSAKLAPWRPWTEKFYHDA